MLLRRNNALLFVNGKLATNCCCECNCCCDSRVPRFNQLPMTMTISNVNADAFITSDDDGPGRDHPLVCMISSPEKVWTLPYLYTFVSMDGTTKTCIWQDTFTGGEDSDSMIFTIRVSINETINPDGPDLEYPDSYSNSTPIDTSCMSIYIYAGGLPLPTVEDFLSGEAGIVDYNSCLDCNSEVFIDHPGLLVDWTGKECDATIGDSSNVNYDGSCCCDEVCWDEHSYNGVLLIDNVTFTTPPPDTIDLSSLTITKHFTKVESACEWEDANPEQGLFSNLTVTNPAAEGDPVNIVTEANATYTHSPTLPGGYTWADTGSLFMHPTCSIINDDSIHTLAVVQHGSDLYPITATILWQPDRYESCDYGTQLQTPAVPCPDPIILPCECDAAGCGLPVFDDETVSGGAVYDFYFDQLAFPNDSSTLGAPDSTQNRCKEAEDLSECDCAKKQWCGCVRAIVSPPKLAGAYMQDDVNINVGIAAADNAPEGARFSVRYRVNDAIDYYAYYVRKRMPDDGNGCTGWWALEPSGMEDYAIAGRSSFPEFDQCYCGRKCDDIIDTIKSAIQIAAIYKPEETVLDPILGVLPHSSAVADAELMHAELTVLIFWPPDDPDYDPCCDCDTDTGDSPPDYQGCTSLNIKCPACDCEQTGGVTCEVTPTDIARNGVDAPCLSCGPCCAGPGTTVMVDEIGRYQRRNLECHGCASCDDPEDGIPQGPNDYLRVQSWWEFDSCDEGMIQFRLTALGARYIGYGSTLLSDHPDEVAGWTCPTTSIDFPAHYADDTNGLYQDGFVECSTSSCDETAYLRYDCCTATWSISYHVALFRGDPFDDYDTPDFVVGGLDGHAIPFIGRDFTGEPNVCGLDTTGSTCEVFHYDPVSFPQDDLLERRCYKTEITVTGAALDCGAIDKGQCLTDANTAVCLDTDPDILTELACCVKVKAKPRVRFRTAVPVGTEPPSDPMPIQVEVFVSGCASTKIYCDAAEFIVTQVCNYGNDAVDVWEIEYNRDDLPGDQYPVDDQFCCCAADATGICLRLGNTHVCDPDTTRVWSVFDYTLGGKITISKNDPGLDCDPCAAEALLEHACGKTECSDRCPCPTPPSGLDDL